MINPQENMLLEIYFYSARKKMKKLVLGFNLIGFAG